MMTYKGYSAIIEVDTEAEILFGRVIDINDVAASSIFTDKRLGYLYSISSSGLKSSLDASV
ncbi:MAG: hypothetical protein SWZ49_05000, partial [Cyanobacteriota bacterium]|nr:hypothetical protein [Cyanobacteriota bacterium]